jgi:peptidoglycan/LPS O-acetylase OafA/YrhL
LVIFTTFAQSLIAMIQRIQSIYLLLAALCSGVVAFFVAFFQTPKEILTLLYFPIFTAVFVLSALISMYSVFRFKNRKQQVMAGRFNIIINFVVFGLMFYHWYEAYSLEPTRIGMGVFLPILVIVFISMANRAIMKDEMLVRSADRLR